MSDGAEHELTQPRHNSDQNAYGQLNHDEEFHCQGGGRAGGNLDEKQRAPVFDWQQLLVKVVAEPRSPAPLLSTGR